MRRIGPNMKNAINFATRNQGWHAFSPEKATRRAIATLVKQGRAEVNKFGQFRLIAL